MTQIPGPAVGPTQQDTNGLDRFFDWLRSLDLRRDTEDKWLAGVCSGTATRLGIDPIVVRAAMVLLTLLGGVGITLYLIAWAFVPNDRSEIVAERAVRHGDVLPIILLIVIALSLFGGTGLAHDTPGVVWFWWLAVPVAVIIWALTRNRATSGGTPNIAGQGAAVTPPWAPGAAPTATTVPGAMPATMSTTPAPVVTPDRPATYGAPLASPYAGAPTTSYAPTPYAPAPYAPTTPYAGGPVSGGPGAPLPPAPVAARPPRAPRPPRRRGAGFVGALLVGGLALAAYGITLWLHDANHWAGSGETVAMGAALAVFGLGILGFGIAGRRAGLTGFIAIVLAFVTWTASVIPDVSFGGGIGDRVWRPAATDTHPQYRLGIGSARLDLVNLPDNPATATPVDARLGIGELRILIPSNLTVEVRSSVGAGDIGQIGDSTDNNGPQSRNISTTETFGVGSPDVVVTAHVGLGQILIGKE